jgi:predicted aspartyl protease
MIKACLRYFLSPALSIAAGMPVQAGELDIHIPLRDKGIATYYVEGQIDGAGVIDLLVDTGAGYTAINEKTLRTLRRKGLATHIKDMSALLADGSRAVVPLYRIRKLNIGGSCEVHDVEVAVLPGKSRCILGLGTLKKVAPFMVSVDPPQLSLSHCGKALSKGAVGAVH